MIVQEIPAIGFGTWQLAEGEEVEASVEAALTVGYRLIDTAAIYGNESGVGVAIKTSGVPREEILLTTKLATGDQGYESALAAFKKSRQRLSLDYIDLYLIHWPGHDQRLRRQSWEALTDLHKDGAAKNIGVSNYVVEYLEELAGWSERPPAVNQIEFHPFVYVEQRPTLEYCRQQGIIVEAYSPLAQGRGLDDAAVRQIAKTHDKTAAQILLRWCIQHGTVPIPKTAHARRIKENYEVFDFELSADEMKTLDNL